MITLLADLVVLAIYAGAVGAVVLHSIPEKLFERLCRLCFPPKQ